MVKQINIIGQGMSPNKHLTLEALDTLAQSEVIFGIETEPGLWGKIETLIGPRHFVDLRELYYNGETDSVNYARFVGHIIEATEQYESIGLLVAGHPRLGVSFVDLLQERINHANTKLQVLSGLSSFDLMLNDLEIDPLERGTVMIDANRLLLFEYDIEPAIGTFIFHVCSVGTQKTNFENPQEDNKMTCLKRYLLRYYEPHKKVVLCRAACGDGFEKRYAEISLEEIDERMDLIDFATTLYIPPEMPRRLNRDFLAELEA